MKTCNTCHEEKTVENFGINSSYKDGRTNKCKKCISAYEKELRSRPADPCVVAMCSKQGRHRRMCPAHYTRWLKTGDVQEDIPVQERVANGQGHITKDGYRILSNKNHPNARSNGRIFEHVLVMSEIIGRPLRDNENVHHRNGNRSDNTPENLELWSTSQPAGQRIEDKLAWAIELLNDYRPELLCSEGNYDLTNLKLLH